MAYEREFEEVRKEKFRILDHYGPSLRPRKYRMVVANKMYKILGLWSHKTLFK